MCGRRCDDRIFVTSEQDDGDAEVTQRDVGRAADSDARPVDEAEERQHRAGCREIRRPVERPVDDEHRHRPQDDARQRRPCPERLQPIIEYADLGQFW